ncbi:MAG: EamA family transporter [Alphaproteobacteria bacterium]
MAFVGVVGGAVAHGLFLLAIRMTTPTRVAIAMPANPLAAILLAAVVLGEPVGPGALAGFACVAAGVILVNLRPRPTG